MRTVLLLLVLAFVAGCGERVVFTDEGADQVVIDGILIVDEPMPEIWITRSLGPQSGVELSIGNLELLSNVTEKDAEVFVVAGGDTVVYEQFRVQLGDLDLRGPYVPAGSAPIVLPTTRYELVVRTARGETVRATTITPERFRVREWVRLDDALNQLGDLAGYDDVAEPDAIYAANRLEWGAGLVEARFEPTAGTRAYQVSLFSRSEDSDFAIEPDFFEDEDFEDIDREGSSPMFEGDDGLVRLPWFAVFFEGPYLIKVYATDENWYDFVRTTPSLAQGNNFGGNAGDSFTPPAFDVEGGIGVFASASVDSIGFCVWTDAPDSVSCEPTR